MRVSLCLALLAFFIPGPLSAQFNQNVWSEPIKLEQSNKESQVHLKQHISIRLNFESLYKEVSGSRTVSEKMYIPAPDGSFKTFTIQPMDIFEPTIQEKYSGFRSFYGYDDSDKSVKIGLTITPFGLTAFVLGSGENTYFIDPVSTSTTHDYVVYYKDQLVDHTRKTFFCKEFSPEDFDLPDAEKNGKNKENSNRVGDCQLRTYRLALACTGEYGIFHGGTIEKVMNAYQVAVTRINVVYRKEIGITMKLVDNVDQLIFLNPSTDPYTNSNTSAMLAQNQSTVDDIIGRPNYDIGHVFGTGDGGIASLGSVCSNTRKAQGVTGRPSPAGDAFFIDYVAHEMGHQFRANHTQNNSCQRNNPTAIEPGSGSTIMGYAGICSPNVQNNSHDYFHSISLSEISSFILSQPGCGVVENLSNTRPQLTLDKSSFTIPISTSFYLKAAGVDDDNDVITFSWDQMNNEVASMPPKPTNVNGPMFRSIPPSTQAIRYFPDLKNKYNQWEVLPSISRSMNFRVTLRDNSENGGCTTEQNVLVKTDNIAGPFVVTEPNVPTVVWLAGNEATVTWNVADTDKSPVSCQSVNIMLSIDGGTSYPVTLAQDVPNNGSAVIIVPNLPTTGARVMVVAADNIFFDVSNFSFEIKNSFDIQFEYYQTEACNQKAVFPLRLNSLGSFSNHEVVFTLLDQPPGFIVQLPDTVRQLPSLDSIFITIPALMPGIYPIILETTDGPFKIKDTLWVLVRNQTLALNLTTPENGALFPAGSNGLWFQWTADLSGRYELEISTKSNFPDSSTLRYDLTINEFAWQGPENTYFCRVRGLSDCLNTPWSATSIFHVGAKNNYPNPLLRNNGLVVSAYERKSITPGHLKIDFEEAYPSSFHLTESPRYGLLIKREGNAEDTLVAGSRFDAADIVAGKLQYEHLGGSETLDSFVFFMENELYWQAPYSFKIYILQTGELQVFLEIDKDIQCFGEQGIIYFSVKNADFPLQYRPLNESQFYTLAGDTLHLTSSNYQFVIKDASGDSTVTNWLKMTGPEKLENHSSQKYYDIEIESTGGAGFSRLFSLDNQNFSSESNFLDIPAGTYVTYVKDINSCLALDTVELVIEPLTLNSFLGNDTLPCPDDVTWIDLEVLGGFPPYHIEYLDSMIAGTSLALGAGHHNLLIFDAGGKFIDTLFMVFAPENLEISLDIQRADIFWSTTGGSPPYQYSFDGVQFFIDEFALDLANGSYTLTVKDDENCLHSITFDINLLQSVTIDITEPLCYGNSASITISPNNGTPPFLVGLDKNNLDSVYVLDGLYAGDYTLYVTDGLGDSIEQMFSIRQPDSLMITFDIKQDTVVVLAKGGTPPYKFSVDQGINFFSFNVFYHVPAGKHDVLIKDANGCITSAEFEILSSAENPSSGFPIRVFPNPVSQELMIELEETSITRFSFSMYNSHGQMVKIPEVRRTGNRILVDVSHLPSGLYLLEILSSDSSGTFTFVKL